MAQVSGHFARLSFIRRARDLGFTFGAVGEQLTPSDDKSQSCEAVDGIARVANTMAIDPAAASCWNYAALLSMEVAGRTNGDGGTLFDNLETLLIFKLLKSDQLQPQPCKIAPHHVRKVERFIVNNADQPVTMEQLVEVGGVSARALFDGFRRFRETSQMAYLKTVRLAKVRKDLQNPVRPTR